jgi:hypothetical protein
MPEGFHRLGGDEPAYEARLSRHEAGVLAQLVAQMVALIRDDLDRADPAIERLFPALYPDDPRAESELREVTEGALRDSKESSARVVLDTLAGSDGELHLDGEQAHSWLLALTDLRLVLGVRLGLNDETDLVSELDDAVADDPLGERVHAITIYHYLSFLQESLVSAITSGLDSEHADQGDE